MCVHGQGSIYIYVNRNSSGRFCHNGEAAAAAAAILPSQRCGGCGCCTCVAEMPSLPPCGARGVNSMAVRLLPRRRYCNGQHVNAGGEVTDIVVTRR